MGNIFVIPTSSNLKPVPPLILIMTVYFKQLMRAQIERLRLPGRNSALILPGGAFDGRTRKFRRPPKHKQLAVKMEPEKLRSLCPEPDQKGANVELRVKIRSKRELIQQLDSCKNILETVLDGQKDVQEETKRVLLRELLAVS